MVPLGHISYPLKNENKLLINPLLLILMVVGRAKLFLDMGYTVRVHIFGKKLTVSFVKDKNSIVKKRLIIYAIGDTLNFQKICEAIEFYPVNGKWINEGKVFKVITLSENVFERFIEYCLKNYKLKYDACFDDCYTIYFEVK